MKILKFALVALLFSTAFVACKKDHDQKSSSASVEGVYAGKYGFGTDTPTESFKFAVKPNGVFQELSVNNGNPTGQGTYTLNGNTITATYNMLWSPYNQYSVKGTFDPSTGKMVGTWGYDNNPADGGKMDMTKQN
ncbi:MAG TPA: hypothetical protein VGQ09_14045 [Chitinophagaceae bacterium]|jgi:hypothetical protein|nr:hypothetical protein [Chitinophagaceae bacterium]